MAASEAGARARRGPAPIASFDHDVSDESSPESKQTFRLPEIREDATRGAGGAGAADEANAAGAALAPMVGRERSHSTPGGALAAPAAPRIDISRASSSSHHDSRDSSPELALFAGAGGDRARLELGFREDGALDLRSSTEELAFLEPAPGEAAAAPARPASAAAAPAPPVPAPAERRHSRKDSQSSEAALLAVSGRTSRLSSVGSQCSAQSALSALSRVSRLSVVSGASRSPSPHRMLLETSFCGPKPIETDPEISAGALVEQILGIATLAGPERPASAASPPTAAPMPRAAPVDARDRREVRTEVTVESARSAPTTPAIAAQPAPVPHPEPPAPASLEPDKNEKDVTNQTYRIEERKARPRVRREPSEPEVYKSKNKSKDIIIIKLRPEDSYEEESSRGASVAAGAAGAGEAARKPATLELGTAARPAEPAPPSPAPSRRRSPSPAGPPVSRKSSFCSLFKSRETIASPESPSEALRRKRSLTEGRSRSKSRDRSSTPTSASKIRGSVLSLFRTPRRSAAGASPSPGSREGSPGVQAARAPSADPRRADRLKYYEDAKDGIIHIPLRTPPEEHGATDAPRRGSGADPSPAPSEAPHRELRPASAPQPRVPSDRAEPQLHSDAPLRGRPEPRCSTTRTPTKPIHRTVLPDGSIIIPLHSPTDRTAEPVRADEPSPVSRKVEEVKAVPNRKEPSPTTATPGQAAVEASPPRERPEPRPPVTPDSGGSPAAEDARRRRKERLVFTTHVGSREQVFSTQFSITKTPSVTSEISGSFPSFVEGEEGRALRDTHITASPPAAASTPSPPAACPAPPGATSRSASPPDAPRDSSESEPSSEAAPSRAGNDVEKRGLVVQESFEEELPYVPTTLPQERPVALPMVPVRERGGVRVAGVQRPRGAAPPAHLPAPPAPAPPAPADKLRIKLPRRPRTSPAPAPPPDRRRTPSGGDSGGESRSMAEWIDFEEVPERRKQPKRIQTLPAGAAGDAAVVFSYVEPEHCRCECHGHARDHQLPLLRDDLASIISTSPAECGPETPPQADARPDVVPAPRDW